MGIEQKKTVKVDELAHMVNRDGGTTFSQIWQVFFYTRLFKYIHRQHYSRIKTVLNKIATKDNLREFCEKGYFTNPRTDIYCATNKVLPILEAAGYAIELLPPEPRGTGDINELNNTEIFIQCAKLEHFHLLLYPTFKYVIPDALLIQIDKENRKYKLTFLEIEAKKPKWSEYLEQKKENYLRLSHDMAVYEYWCGVAPKLSLPIPKVDNFKFSVSFYCTLERNFGNGFNFINKQ